MMRNHYFKGYSPSNFIVVAFFSLIRLYLFFLRWFVLLLVQHTNAHGLSENPKKDYFQGHESVLKGPPPSLQVAKKLIIHQREIQKNPMTEIKVRRGEFNLVIGNIVIRYVNAKHFLHFGMIP
ncbi:uncharacterized protein [Nicotiana tomentosiformis]|uniref:uncharacterized protein isoform X6 n=1 Tax=Nicotiana tomentosiformis TaxID=4098 RepID=UPI00388C6D8A